jgi:NAD(P)-dependent dehydrogenase (short-subunit alcohol dehydrogenase family)
MERFRNSTVKMDGKVSLITGGTRGMGAATALELARLGSEVALVGRHIDSEASAGKEMIEALGRHCLLIAADVSLTR